MNRNGWERPGHQTCQQFSIVRLETEPSAVTRTTTVPVPSITRVLPYGVVWVLRPGMYVWNSLRSEKRWNGRDESMIMYEGIGINFWVFRGFLGGIVDVQWKKRRSEKKW